MTLAFNTCLHSGAENSFRVQECALLILKCDCYKKQSVGNSPNECFVVPPECPNKNITFYLYTRNHQNSPHRLDISDVNTILNANFIYGSPVKFIVHGYTGHRDYSPNMELRPAYFKNYELNIISVDYGPLVREPCYIEAVENVQVVANCSAQLIDAIIGLRPDINLRQFHVIGLSLGAQVSGQIFQFLKHGYFERVTGLDPALPLFFNFKPATSMLNKYSGKFVDVIHTNGGIKGKLSAVGDVDFYVNSGTFQPGCGYNTSCSHVRAAVYYAESINSEVGFWSAPCSSLYLYYFGECGAPSMDKVMPMGEFVPRSARGLYFVDTNDSEPFALGIKPFENNGKWNLLSNKKKKNYYNG